MCSDWLNVHASARAIMSLASTRERRSVRPPKRAYDDADAWPARCVCQRVVSNKRNVRFCCALNLAKQPSNGEALNQANYQPLIFYDVMAGCVLSIYCIRAVPPHGQHQLTCSALRSTPSGDARSRILYRASRAPKGTRTWRGTLPAQRARASLRCAHPPRLPCSLLYGVKLKS